MKTTKWLLLIPAIWGALPWVFWCVYHFHKPDHADPLWLPAMPFVFVSFIPMLLFGNGTQNPDWFPLGWVAGSSVFNLAAGGLLFLFVSVYRSQRNA